MSLALNPLHSSLQILHALLMQIMPHMVREVGVSESQSVHGSLELQSTQQRRLQFIFPRQSLREDIDSDESRKRRRHTHPQREVNRPEQIATQLPRHIGDFQSLEVVVPIFPELVQRGRPHLGRHLQRCPEDGEFFAQCLECFSWEFPEERLVDDNKGSE